MRESSPPEAPRINEGFVQDATGSQESIHNFILVNFASILELAS